MIEKRTLGNGTVVGFNTETNSFCTWTGEQPVKTETSLDEMNAEQLTAYAQEHNIDIGMSTSIDGIMKKIRAAQAVM